MISFNPHWGGVDYFQDTPPNDRLGPVFTPSMAIDTTAAQPQLESQESAHQFMQSQYRAVTENVYDSGLIVSSTI